MSLSAGDYRYVLELVAEALRCAGPGFPGAAVTGFLARVFDAELVSAGDVDLRGTASRRWADAPRQIPMNGQGFHEFAIDHPLARAHRRPGGSVPLRLSDVATPREIRPTYDEFGMSHVLTIPLAVTPQHICAVAVMRSGPDFTPQNLALARQLQPVLSGIYIVRDRIADDQPTLCDTDTGVPITARELGVLNLMADGLIAAAIARRLGISPRTVSKHIESIYRKLGTHDRTSAVLRGQALGILPRQGLS